MPLFAKRELPSCLALHGLGGGPFEFGQLLDALTREGIHVLAPVLPGHDRPALVMPASRWQDWAAAVEQAFDQLARLGAPVAIVGFSTGGTLALWLASRRPVARLALLAPFLAIRYSSLVPISQKYCVHQLARITPTLPRRDPPIRDREARQRARALEPFRTFNLHATLSALELIDQVKPLVPSIKTPTLIIQGRHDSVVEPRAASWLYDHLGSTEKELIWLPRSDHLLALDHDRDRLVTTVVRFVKGETD
jgi:carboxylesterase